MIGLKCTMLDLEAMLDSNSKLRWLDVSLNRLPSLTALRALLDYH